jgi:hypothetical protein
MSLSATLTSDPSGTLLLGPLAQVTSLTATATHNGYASSRTWKPQPYSEQVTYGGPVFNNSYKLYLTEGESLTLPVPC